MTFDILTCLPELFEGPLNQSIVKRAKEKGLVQINVYNLRDYSPNKHRSVDDYAYGGGAGMVLGIEPIDRCINYLKGKKSYDQVVYMTPDGHPLNQKVCNNYSQFKNIIILCGHYKGVDERVRQYLITHEISIGSYVISGGELAAMVFADAIIRLIPGVLNNETSALTDSFQDNMIAPPIFTRPDNYNGWKVPKVLLSGHQKEIEEWREGQSFKRTQERYPDLNKS